MKLRKDKWEKTQIGYVVAELRNKSSYPIEDGYDRYIGFEHIEPENIYLKQFGNLSDGVTFNKTFKTNDVLFGKIRAYLKKVAIAPIDGICSGDILVLRTKDENKLSQAMLPYFLTTQSFLKCSVDSSVGTTLPRTKWQHLSKHEIFLPPLEEQKQIAALFQSIDAAIEGIDRQEKDLKALQKTLSNSLVNPTPAFGNLLSDKNCNPCIFEDIADCIETHDKKPLENGITRFVGLENIDADNFNLQGFGDIQKGTTFTKRFLRGDVLFGKRRAYLKKVAVADFDGICSGDILVFRANITKMLPDLLPYYVSSDAFIQHAVSTSAGSLSPRTKWRDLAALEISIPDMETQKMIAGVFKQLQLTLDQLKQQKITLKNLKQKLLSEILG